MCHLVLPAPGPAQLPGTSFRSTWDSWAQGLHFSNFYFRTFLIHYWRGKKPGGHRHPFLSDFLIYPFYGRGIWLQLSSCFYTRHCVYKIPEPVCTPFSCSPAPLSWAISNPAEAGGCGDLCQMLCIESLVTTLLPWQSLVSLSFYPLPYQERSETELNNASEETQTGFMTANSRGTLVWPMTWSEALNQIKQREGGPKNSYRSNNLSQLRTALSAISGSQISRANCYWYLLQTIEYSLRWKAVYQRQFLGTEAPFIWVNYNTCISKM